MRYPFFCAKLFSARSVSAMITTATDKLIVTTSSIGTNVRSGKLHRGSPGDTASNVLIPHSFIGKICVKTAPAAIITTAIGNFGIIFFAASKMTSEKIPKINDGRLICSAVFSICSRSSNNSPVPAVPPISFGTCIKMIVEQIPVMNPPITGAEI